MSFVIIHKGQSYLVAELKSCEIGLICAYDQVVFDCRK